MLLSDSLPHFDRPATDHPEFYYNDRTGRYHYRDTNKFVSQQARDNLTRGHLNQVREDLRGAADRLGKISFTRWQRETFTQVKIAHAQSYMLGRGGIHRMDASDYAALKKEMRFQRDYFKRFAGQILNGELSDAMIRHRLTSYGESAKTSHENGLLSAAIAAGFDEEKNILGAGESCNECLTLTRKGWVKIGVMPRPGRRECIFNCNCRIEKRRSGKQKTSGN